MERKKIFDDFIKEHLDLGFSVLKDIDNYYLSAREFLVEKLRKTLIQLLKQIREAQANGTKEEISYIYICFFRSKFHMRDGTVRIYAYDRRFELDPSPLWVEVDFSDLCEFLWNLEDALCLTLNRYKNRIYKSDVQALIQTGYIHKIIGRITAIAKLAIRDVHLFKYIEEIVITEDFSILSGEYQGDFEEILVTEAVDTKGLSLSEFFKIHRKEQDAFCCRRYLEQGVAHSDLSGMNFTKSRFIRMDFSDSDFSNSMLSGTEWQQCRLDNTCWKGASLFGAAFLNSDLSGADFSEIIAPAVPDNIYFSLLSNLDGLCFHGANLENVKFAGADLRGADFRGAELKHTDFSGAFLAGTVFHKESLAQIELSPDQLAQIRK